MAVEERSSSPANIEWTVPPFVLVCELRITNLKFEMLKNLKLVEHKMAS